MTRATRLIGVVKPGFPLFDSDVYSLIGQWNAPPMRSRSAGLGLHGIGRLKPGVTRRRRARTSTG